MTGFLEDGFLRSMFDFTDQDIADLNALIPDLQNLITVARSHQAQANRVLNKGLPLLQKILAKERTMT